MLYNSENPVDVQNAITKLKYFIDKKVIFELTEKRKKRSYSQNNYQHLLFSWFALQTGYTAEEVKQEIYKKIVNSNIFYEGEFGELVKIERWRSTSDLDTSETTTAINRFRDYSSKEAGIYLPEPDDLILLQEIEIQISKTKHYL
jgi:hypothetical protein